MSGQGLYFMYNTHYFRWSCPRCPRRGRHQGTNTYLHVSRVFYARHIHMLLQHTCVLQCVAVYSSARHMYMFYCELHLCLVYSTANKWHLLLHLVPARHMCVAVCCSVYSTTRHMCVAVCCSAFHCKAHLHILLQSTHTLSLTHAHIHIHTIYVSLQATNVSRSVTHFLSQAFSHAYISECHWGLFCIYTHLFCLWYLRCPRRVVDVRWGVLM